MRHFIKEVEVIIMPLFEVGTHQSFIYNKPALKKNGENGDHSIFRNVKYIYATNDEEAKEKYKRWFYIERQPVFTGTGNWDITTEGVNLYMEDKYTTIKEESIKIRKREVNVSADKLCKNMCAENFRDWWFDGNKNKE